jgi:ankyrin repeat protein
MKKFQKKKNESSDQVGETSGKGKKGSSTKVIKQAVQDKAIEFIKSGNIEALEKMLEEGSDEIKFLNRLHTKSGKSSLGVSAEEGRIGSLEMLLRAKPELDLVDKTGMTALLYAAKSGELEMIEMLHVAGADVHVKSDKKEENALILAASSNHIKCVELLEYYGLALDDKNKLDETALSIGLKYEYFPLCKFLVERSADINVRGKNGDTPLIRTAFDGREKTAIFILENKGDVNIKNVNGETALMIACKHGQKSIVELLVSNGAVLDDVDNGGKTALMFACILGKYEIMFFLVEKGASINLVDAWGYSALMHLCNRNMKGSPEAAVQEYLSCVEALVQLGAHIDSMDRNYSTSLMLACSKGSMELVLLLLRLGADPRFRTLDDRLPSELMRVEEDRVEFEEFVRNMPHRGTGVPDYTKPGVRLIPEWMHELNVKRKANAPTEGSA